MTKQAMKKPTPSRKALKAPTRAVAIKKPTGSSKRQVAAPKQPTSKLDRVLALMRQPGGATLQTLIDATGWQAHSIRGAISGTIKKKLALTVESQRIDGERVYRIAG